MKKIGEILIESGKVSERDIERAMLAQREMGERIGQVLVKLGLVSELDMTQALSQQLDIPLLLAADYPEEPIEVPEVSPDFLFSNHVVPVSRTDTEVTFAATMPQESFLIKALGMAMSRPVKVVFGLETDIAKALEARAGGGSEEEEDEFGDRFSGQSDDEFIEHLKDLASEAPVIRLVNLILQRAVEARASDIHIEPFENRLKVRYRIDGVLQEVEAPPASSTAAVISRIKIMANLNIAEHRLPQDGRIKIRLSGKEIDIRVSIIPIAHGERVVCNFNALIIAALIIPSW